MGRSVGEVGIAAGRRKKGVEGKWMMLIGWEVGSGIADEVDERAEGAARRRIRM